MDRMIVCACSSFARTGAYEEAGLSSVITSHLLEIPTEVLAVGASVLSLLICGLKSTASHPQAQEAVRGG